MIEAGGKDPLIVDADADIVAAADAALWGACSNAGQTCAGVERVYVHEQVYDEFLAEITRKAQGLSAHDGDDAKIGPITMPSQIEVIRRHIDDALERGGRAVVGGAGAVGERFVQPTILVDVPEDSAAIRSGMTAINAVISFAAIPGLPFGGVGDSGFGRIHGPEGLKEFTYAKAIARQRFKPALALTTFDRTEQADRRLAAVVKVLHGRG